MQDSVSGTWNFIYLLKQKKWKVESVSLTSAYWQRLNLWFQSSNITFTKWELGSFKPSELQSWEKKSNTTV